MFEINIIHEKAIPSALSSKIKSYYMIGILMAWIVLAVYVMMIINVSSKTKKQQLIMDSLNASIQTIIEQHDINTWSKEWKSFYKEIYVIDKVYSDRISLPAKLYEFNALLPEKMSIESIVLAKDNTHILLNLVALADEQDEYAEVKRFIDQLDNSLRFKKGVRLVSQERTQLNNKIVSLIGIKIPLVEKKKNG